MTKIVTPSSRGRVTLKSAKPEDLPVCDPNMLSTELDKKLLSAAVRLTAKGLEQSIAPEYGLCENGVDDSLKGDYSDDAMMKRALNTVRTVNHGCGTCSMGAVVDSDCRVKGVSGLRVVDTSIIPLPLSAHYQAPAYGIAEKVRVLMERLKCTVLEANNSLGCSYHRRVLKLGCLDLCDMIVLDGRLSVWKLCSSVRSHSFAK
jgi:choline dehydrogenase-like flavoprotein